MDAFEKVHSGYVYKRRVSVLSSSIESLLPSSARVLDLGCGDALISYKMAQQKRDIKVFGADVLFRTKTFIPAVSFDGKHLPFRTQEFDLVMLIDVLHHTENAMETLQEAARVSKKYLIIKDHLCEGFLAKSTLRFMDIVGNLRFGVNLPFNYLSRDEWYGLFQKSDLEIERWIENLYLYPWWANWFFGRSLHFLSRLKKASSTD